MANVLLVPFATGDTMPYVTCGVCGGSGINGEDREGNPITCSCGGSGEIFYMDEADESDK